MDKVKKARIEAQLAKIVRESKIITMQTCTDVRSVPGGTQVIRRRKGTPETRISITYLPDIP